VASPGQGDEGSENGMFEDPLCSLSKSLDIHSVDAARPPGRTSVCADAPIYPRGNFITDATVRLSHGQPSSHRPTVRPSVRPSILNRPSDNPEWRWQSAAAYPCASLVAKN
jgi:hypothetical protein